VKVYELPTPPASGDRWTLALESEEIKAISLALYIEYIVLYTVVN
jgi:hypothetical protein